MKKRKNLIILIVIVCIIISVEILKQYGIVATKTYNLEDFGYKTIYSTVDFNNNGIDDYTDILNGARKDALNKPKYDGTYYAGGYPPDNIGVCTDVIWRAFMEAGYLLKDMVDLDITNYRTEYPNVLIKDSNIDFRRVVNLRIFFDRHATALTLDVSDIQQWQPGDIVIFGDNKHIGIVSDKRNKKGIAYIIHNGGQTNREEDYLSKVKPVAHYRFDASKIDKYIIKKLN